MKRTQLALRKIASRGHEYWQVTVPRPGGGRSRKTFKERTEAEAYFKFMQDQLADFGTSVTAISDNLRLEATQAQRLLEPYGVSILAAAQRYVMNETPLPAFAAPSALGTERIQKEIVRKVKPSKKNKKSHEK